MKKTIEKSMRDRILFIGENIPTGLLADERPKFILLGTPQEVLDETTENLQGKSVHEMVCWIAEYAYKKTNPNGKFSEPPSIVYEQVERDFEKFLLSE